MQLWLNFNTSHVSINRRDPRIFMQGVFISIHLMFLLIVLVICFQVSQKHFNTSHVSINQSETV